MMSKML